jgi:hypothetical protein
VSERTQIADPKPAMAAQLLCTLSISHSRTGADLRAPARP